MRKSGKKALIQLKRGASGTPFDISGVSSDGRGRANDFSFNVAGDTVEAVGYNESWKETIPTGQSAWEAKLKVFYNVASNEVNQYLWTMWQEQHDAAECVDPQDYTLYIMPEGNCTGKERWVGELAVIKSLDIQTPLNEVMVIDIILGGWEMSREIITGG